MVLYQAIGVSSVKGDLTVMHMVICKEEPWGWTGWKPQVKIQNRGQL